MWLPVQSFISDETVFLKPDPSNTITVPGNSRLPITVGAYDHRNNSIYIHSSRGYISRDSVKPDLAAPGVDVLGPANTSVHSGILKTHRHSPTAPVPALPLLLLPEQWPIF